MSRFCQVARLDIARLSQVGFFVRLPGWGRQVTGGAVRRHKASQDGRGGSDEARCNRAGGLGDHRGATVPGTP